MKSHEPINNEKIEVYQFNPPNSQEQEDMEEGELQREERNKRRIQRLLQVRQQTLHHTKERVKMYKMLKEKIHHAGEMKAKRRYNEEKEEEIAKLQRDLVERTNSIGEAFINAQDLNEMRIQKERTEFWAKKEKQGIELSRFSEAMKEVRKTRSQRINEMAALMKRKEKAKQMGQEMLTKNQKFTNKESMYSHHKSNIGSIHDHYLQNGSVGIKKDGYNTTDFSQSFYHMNIKPSRPQSHPSKTPLVVRTSDSEKIKSQAALEMDFQRFQHSKEAEREKIKKLENTSNERGRAAMKQVWNEKMSQQVLKEMEQMKRDESRRKVTQVLNSQPPPNPQYLERLFENIFKSR